jgi:hypothetical protein
MQEVGTIKCATAAWNSNYYLNQNIQYILYKICASFMSLSSSGVNIIVLSVSFIAEVILCAVETLTQLP